MKHVELAPFYMDGHIHGDNFSGNLFLPIRITRSGVRIRTVICLKIADSKYKELALIQQYLRDKQSGLPLSDLAKATIHQLEEVAFKKASSRLTFDIENTDPVLQYIVTDLVYRGNDSQEINYTRNLHPSVNISDLGVFFEASRFNSERKHLTAKEIADIIQNQAKTFDIEDKLYISNGEVFISPELRCCFQKVTYSY